MLPVQNKMEVTSMYYSSGNYEAFARPLKPEGIEHKSAYFIGTGLAALSAGCFLVRDAQMPGKNIHFFDRDPVAGGACDGWHYEGLGYVMRGGREMDNHFEVMWDLFRSIPSIETEGVSVLDEYYWLNKRDPNYSLMRATVNRGEDAHTDGKFGLSDQGAMEIMKLFFTPDEALYDKRITDVFSSAVLESNFWLYWRTMFAFENWHSALEMKLYLKRYIHHIGGLPDFTALRFTRYNQYESIILPMVTYLKDHGVQFYYDTKVVDVQFSLEPGKKQAAGITVDGKNKENAINFLKIFSSMGVQEGLTALKNPSPLVGGPATQELDQIENIVNNATSISGNYGDLQQYGDWFVNVLGPLSTQLINGAITPEAFITQLDTDTAAFYQ